MKDLMKKRDLWSQIKMELLAAVGSLTEMTAEGLLMSPHLIAKIRNT